MVPASHASFRSIDEVENVLLLLMVRSMIVVEFFASVPFRSI